MQEIYQDDYKKLYQGKYCKINYVNQIVKVKVETNFELNTFKVFINGDLCIGSHMDKNVFQEQKVGLVITGFSSLKSPMKLQLREISPYKYSFSDLPHTQTFHYNTNNLLSHLDKYDEKHRQGKSLSNLLYVQQ